MISWNLHFSLHFFKVFRIALLFSQLLQTKGREFNNQCPRILRIFALDSNSTSENPVKNQSNTSEKQSKTSESPYSKSGNYNDVVQRLDTEFQCSWFWTYCHCLCKARFNTVTVSVFSFAKQFGFCYISTWVFAVFPLVNFVFVAKALAAKLGECVRKHR